jgi:AcrR family transcriptional regulator
MGTQSMVESHKRSADSGLVGTTASAAHGEGSATRKRILDIALTLMSQRGVNGTSMRDLAGAAGLNVASLYHYFPSKRDLLQAVLVEQGIFPVRAPRADAAEPEGNPSTLAELLADVLLSMFEVEDFVRLIMGEAMRDEPTARGIGQDLFTSFEGTMESWVTENRPDLAARAGADATARLLSALAIGIFIQHASGVLDGQDQTALSLQRAAEAADILKIYP